MVRSLERLAVATVAVLGIALNSAAARTGVAWAGFTTQPARLPVSGTTLSDFNTQVLFRTADLDKDGWDDVVVVRKPQASQKGGRPAAVNDATAACGASLGNALRADVP